MDSSSNLTTVHSFALHVLIVSAHSFHPNPLPLNQEFLLFISPCLSIHIIILLHINLFLSSFFLAIYISVINSILVTWSLLSGIPSYRFLSTVTKIWRLLYSFHSSNSCCVNHHPKFGTFPTDETQTPQIELGPFPLNYS